MEYGKKVWHATLLWLKILWLKHQIDMSVREKRIDREVIDVHPKTPDGPWWVSGWKLIGFRPG